MRERGKMEKYKMIVPLAVFLILVVLESLFPLFEERRRARHYGRNLALFLFNTLVLALLFTHINSDVLNLSARSSWSLTGMTALPYWLKTAASILLFDAWMYVWHRLAHRIPLLWKFHRMHHSDTEMDVSTAVRFHTGELLISSVLRLGVFYIIGMDLFALLLYETIMMVNIYFQHSNVFVPAQLDRLLRTVIATPRMHWVHHSKIREETDSNYGTIFSFWDRLGKTFSLRQDPRNIEYGLDEFREENWQTVPGMLKTPFVDTKASLKS